MKSTLSKYFLITTICLAGLLVSCSKQKDEAKLVIERYIELRNHFNALNDAWGDYKVNMALESIINYTLVTGDQSYTDIIDTVYSLRRYELDDTIDYRGIPFADPYYAYYKLKNDPSFIEPFLHQAEDMRQSVWRSAEGAVGITHNDQHALLIDYIQDYGSRMARAGMLSGDDTWFAECVVQFELYATILRYPLSGLYSQGRGWLPDTMALSPSCWSRGQGWLIRGMVESLDCMEPNTDYYERLQLVLKEFADALLDVQDEQGMWRCLPCMNVEKSTPEVSGTSLISYYLALAYTKGMLKDEKYRDAALHAVEGIKNYIDGQGNISNISKGPGPLRTVVPYYEQNELNDPHGFPAVIYALTGALMLKAE